jgi:hypothetical protein
MPNRPKRLARMLLIVMACSIPIPAGVVFWGLGIDVHPHRLVFASIVTGCAVAWAIGSTGLVYYARMKGARKL